MSWPSWSDAAIAALVSTVVAFGLRRFRPASRIAVSTSPAALEFALVASLYSIWRLARQLPLMHAGGAIDRAHDIVSVQGFLHLPSELSLQHFVIRHEWLGYFTTTYYATAHVPVLIVFLVWLYVRHRDEYPHWRNGLAFVTACCLFIRFVRVAPPRLLPELGFVDLSDRFGFDVYGPVGSGVSDQFAAMPSIHVAWAAVVSLGIVAASTSWVRWVFLAHVTLTMLVVSASGNHWWLDGVVAMALLGVGLTVDSAARRAAIRRRSTRVYGEEEVLVDLRAETVRSGGSSEDCPRAL